MINSVSLSKINNQDALQLNNADKSTDAVSSSATRIIGQASETRASTINELNKDFTVITETLTVQFSIGILQQQVRLKQINPHTLIHKAILENNPEVIKFLLEQGVGVDYPDENGMSPLTIAILNRCNYAVDVLLAKGAKPNTKWNGMSLLELALTMKDENSVLQLIEHGADVNARNQNQSVLSMATTYAYHPDGKGFGDWVRVAKAMIEKGANIHLFENGDCPLLNSLWTQDKSLLQLLINKGIDLNMVVMFRGKQNTTPLLTAIHSKDLSLVKFLVESGADVNKTINYGSEILSPLQKALRWNCPEIVQYLLQHGARA